MRSAAHPTSRGLLIPCGEIEIYLLQGWQLLDEPTCGLVRFVFGDKGFVVVFELHGAAGTSTSLR